jgi:hypothetical protein
MKIQALSRLTPSKNNAAAAVTQDRPSLFPSCEERHWRTQYPTIQYPTIAYYSIADTHK